MSSPSTNWYAVYTRPRWEKKVAAQLQDKDITYYCPLNKKLRQWSDRKKIVLEPLFKGYVFVQVAEEKKWDLLSINGIVNYVHWLGKPAKIRNEEINTIRKFLDEFESVDVEKDILPVQASVRIKQGVLMNYKGMVLEIMGNKARIRIESMGLQLSVVFERKNLELING